MRTMLAGALFLFTVAGCGGGGGAPDGGDPVDLAGADLAVDCSPTVGAVTAVSADMNVTILGSNLTQGSKDPFYSPAVVVKIKGMVIPVNADGRSRLVMTPDMSLYDQPVTVTSTMPGCGSFTFTMPWTHV